MKKTIIKVGLVAFCSFLSAHPVLADEYKTQNTLSENIMTTSLYENYRLFSNKNPELVPVTDIKEPVFAQEPQIEVKPLTPPEQKSFFGQYLSDTQDLILKAMSYIGTPYKWGGKNYLTGLDCSGLVKAAYENSVGLILPNTAKEMSFIGKKISISDLKPGDLVFFNTMRRAFSHVGIYVGDNKFLHSPRKGQEVRIEDMDSSYWVKRFNGGRRILSGEPNQELVMKKYLTSQ